MTESGLLVLLTLAGTVSHPSTDDSMVLFCQFPREKLEGCGLWPGTGGRMNAQQFSPGSLWSVCIRSSRALS